MPHIIDLPPGPSDKLCHRCREMLGLSKIDWHPLDDPLKGLCLMHKLEVSLVMAKMRNGRKDETQRQREDE